jgi:Copper type II ascorbate-dependent monooxygenase, C-terminal domain
MNPRLKSGGRSSHSFTVRRLEFAYNVFKMNRIRLSYVLGVLAISSTALLADTTPTYSKDVAPILYKNCASCHRPGDIGPMSLLTYEQVRPWAKSIREKVSTGVMPPWHAEAPRGTFSNDRRLSDQDKNTLVAWANGGAPEGNKQDLPPQPQFAEGWEIGKPDFVVAMNKEYSVPATGTIAYQYFTMPTNFTEDKWIQAIEVKPGVRSVVHHILVFVRESGPPRPQPFISLGPVKPNGERGQGIAATGPGTLIATTAPGTNAMTFDSGNALLVKAGATLVFQVHYTANGKATSDLSSVGFVFAKQAPQKEVRTSAFVNATFVLPAGDGDKAVDSAIEFKQDSHITAIFPHTHLRGKSWEYRLVYPDGRKEVVLAVPRYDFNWQTYYIFTKPLAVPKGARLEATAHYDNSSNNKWNPDAKIDVRWGEQTWQEMQYSGITYTVDDAPMPQQTTAPAPAANNR